MNIKNFDFKSVWTEIKQKAKSYKEYVLFDLDNWFITCLLAIFTVVFFPIVLFYAVSIVICLIAVGYFLNKKLKGYK